MNTTLSVLGKRTMIEISALLIGTIGLNCFASLEVVADNAFGATEFILPSDRSSSELSHAYSWPSITRALTYQAHSPIPPAAPSTASPSNRQWAQDWTQCIHYDGIQNKLENKCTEDLEVYWISETSGSWNSVTIRAGRYYRGGHRPSYIAACWAPAILDRDARRCYIPPWVR